MIRTVVETAANRRRNRGASEYRCGDSESLGESGGSGGGGEPLVVDVLVMPFVSDDALL